MRFMTKKKELDGNKFERMMRILAVLSIDKYKTADELSELLNVDKRTIFRYIRDIKNAFDEETHCELVESSKYGYKLIDTNFTDTLKGLNDYYTIAAIKTTPFGKNLNAAPKIKKELISKVVSRIGTTGFIADNNLDTIFKALVNNYILQIDYTSKSGEIKQHKVLPLKLISNANFYYLQCFDYGYNKIIQLFVGKIEKIETKEIFTDVNFINEKLEYIDSRWGMMADDTLEFIADVEFETDKSAYDLLSRSPLHSSMTCEEKDGKRIFRLKVHNAQEFVRWSYRFGKHITILGPEWVIDIIISEANKLIVKYRPEVALKKN